MQGVKLQSCLGCIALTLRCAACPLCRVTHLRTRLARASIPMRILTWVCDAVRRRTSYGSGKRACMQVIVLRWLASCACI